MRPRHLTLVAGFAVGTGIVWWMLADAKVEGVALREEKRRMWGYLGKPSNRLALWCSEKLRARDRKKGQLSENALDFDGASMCWGYSNPTSAWFAFGNNVSGSNLAYFEFALSTTQSVAAAVRELPTLIFHGADSNYWAHRVGPNEIAFQSNTVGHGAVRLTTGSVLFVRHVEHLELVHLLHFESIKEGWWGDLSARFQRGVIPSNIQGQPKRRTRRRKQT
jgi:hypothetical protein